MTVSPSPACVRPWGWDARVTCGTTDSGGGATTWHRWTPTGRERREPAPWLGRADSRAIRRRCVSSATDLYERRARVGVCCRIDGKPVVVTAGLRLPEDISPLSPEQLLAEVGLEIQSVARQWRSPLSAFDARRTGLLQESRCWRNRRGTGAGCRQGRTGGGSCFRRWSFSAAQGSCRCRQG